MNEIEESFREAALICGKIVLSKFLSELPEETPICPMCGEKMKNHGQREKQIVTRLEAVNIHEITTYVKAADMPYRKTIC